MTPTVSTNRYKDGETISPKSNPQLRLVIRRYLDRIYYCRDSTGKEYALFEREILASE